MNQHQWLIFLPAALLVAASPGAGNFLALTHGLRGGWGLAVMALLGRFAAFAIMILLVMLGVGALLAASAVAFSILKWAGVAYLVWLGLRLWRSDSLPVTASVEDRPGSWRQLTLREFTVAATNPKAMLLFTAFLPQFLVSGRPMEGQFVMLGGAYILIEFAAASGYALAGSRIKALRLGRGGARRINRITGAVMLAAAGWLATMRRAA
jgi:threonine/homoserine/homoserine lactone efflux protein